MMTHRIASKLLLPILLPCLLLAAALAQEAEPPPQAAQPEVTPAEESPPQPLEREAAPAEEAERQEQQSEATQTDEAAEEPQPQIAQPEQAPLQGPPTALDEARALLNSGRPVAALEILRTLPLDGPDRISVLFNRGLAAIAVSQLEGLDPGARRRFQDEAIAIFRTVLVDSPELVRVRLELARAFFMSGQDELARRHFELVLGGPLPPQVVVNIRRFLEALRERKRLTGYFGAAIAPDSNLNFASEEDIIYLDTVFGRLPFRREEASTEERSGLGLSVWAGGEYQLPLSQRLRMRMGADLAQRDYGGTEFDQSFLAGHVGPRWLVSPRTDISLLGTAHRQWLGTYPQIDESGMRLEIDHQLARRFWLRGTASSSVRECHNCEWRNGPQTGFSLSTVWTPAPVLQVHLTVGYDRDHARVEHWRSLSRWVRVGSQLALPLGFTLGTTAQMRRTYYAGEGGAHFTLTGRQRLDRSLSFGITILNRVVALYGFSPQLALIHEARATNAQAQGYERDRAELRLVRQF